MSQTNKTIHQTRLENARLLVGGRSLAEFAQSVGRSPTQISRLIGKNTNRNIGHKLAREFERNLGMPIGWLDTDHSNGVASSRLVGASPAGIQLSSLQLATLEMAENLMRKGRLTDFHCIDLMHSWREAGLLQD